jgi:uncharacterized protein (DUF1501 family)
LPKSKLLTLQSGADHYWHPSLQPFKTLFDNGDLAIIENIGYPNPNLSHFTSEKKWYSADPSAQSAGEGWLSNYLENAYPGSFAIPAINLGARLNGSFLGSRVPVFRRITDYQFEFDQNYFNRLDNGLQREAMLNNGKVLRVGSHENVQFVSDSTVDAANDSELLQSIGSTYSPRASYRNTNLGRSLQIVARYISGGLESQIYYASTGGFDTHANQTVSGAPETGAFATGIADVSGNIKAFLDDMRSYGKNKKVVVMVYSEFGRRFGENGSLGTDHGHGGTAFLAGEPVTGGRYGTPPDLSAATSPYNRYYIPFDANSTDFRSMYATVLQNWFGVNHTPILNGTYPLLGAL